MCGLESTLGGVGGFGDVARGGRSITKARRALHVTSVIAYSGPLGSELVRLLLSSGCAGGSHTVTVATGAGRKSGYSHPGRIMANGSMRGKISAEGVVMVFSGTSGMCTSGATVAVPMILASYPSRWHVCELPPSAYNTRIPTRPDVSSLWYPLRRRFPLRGQVSGTATAVLLLRYYYCNYYCSSDERRCTAEREWSQPSTRMVVSATSHPSAAMTSYCCHQPLRGIYRSDSSAGLES
eukprot:gene10968-biopygen465